MTLSQEFFLTIFNYYISVVLIKITDDTDDKLSMFIDFTAEPFSVLIYGEDLGEIPSLCTAFFSTGIHIDTGVSPPHRCGSHKLRGTNLPFENWVVIYRFIL